MPGRVRSVVVAAIAIAAALLPADAPAAPAPVLYGANDNSLYTIDPATAAETLVGVGRAGCLTGIAFDPTTSVLYGVNGADCAPTRLYTIDRATGAATVVGPLGGGGAAPDIDFDGGGQLYAAHKNDSTLTHVATIDKATGALADIGAGEPTETVGDGFAIDRSGLAHLLATGDDGNLWTANLGSGAFTTTGPALIGAPDAGSPVPAASFACDGTTLWAAMFSGPGNLVTIDTASGAVTDHGAFSNLTGDDDLTRLDAFAWYCPVELGVAAASTHVAESAGTATVTVARSGGVKGAFSVDYATANGSATAGSDYTARSGTLTIPDGQTSAPIAIPLADDDAIEGDETFTLTLSSPSSPATVGASVTTVTIDASDAPTTAPTPVTPLVPEPLPTLISALVALDRPSLKTLFRRGARVSIGCNQQCSTTVDLFVFRNRRWKRSSKLRRVAVPGTPVLAGRKHVDLSAAGTRTVRVELFPKAKAVLRHIDRFTLSVGTTAWDAHGEQRTLQRTSKVHYRRVCAAKRGCVH